MLEHTLDQITQLKLQGLKAALLEQVEGGGKYTDMSFEERLSLLIDREVTDRKNRSIQRMLRLSKLKDKQAHISDLDYRTGRGIDKGLIKTLSKNEWIEQKQNILITGPTGTGKSFLASALANQAPQYRPAKPASPHESSENFAGQTAGNERRSTKRKCEHLPHCN